MKTRDRILERLRGGVPVGGQSLAEEFCISRVAVSKHVSSLRELGYSIEASPATGYLLTGSPDAPLPSEVAPLVDDPLWRRFEGGVPTSSTNDDARTLARQQAEEGTVVLAPRQTAGRGRLGRTWESPSGGSYVSVVLRPPLPPAEMGPLALVVALGLARGFSSMGVATRLKWPNDVLLGDGKLAGVLLEMTAEGDRVDWVVAGFGINVRRPTESWRGAAYLSDVLPHVRIPVATAAALDGIASAYRDWLSGGFVALGREYAALDALAGSRVTVASAEGVIHARGRACGVEASGRLLVETPEGTRAVSSGEATVDGEGVGRYR